MSENEERNVTGTVANWARDIKSIGAKGNFFSVGVKIGSDWHNLTSHNVPALEEVRAAFPKGSNVEFTEIKKGDYWNVKEGTFGPAQGTVAPIIETSTVRDEFVSASGKSSAKHINGQALGLCFKIACDVVLVELKKENGSMMPDNFVATATVLAEKLYKANAQLLKKLEEE